MRNARLTNSHRNDLRALGHQDQSEWLRPWTPDRALRRYLALADRFDATRFTERPPTFKQIPWLTLYPPADLQVHDVDWDTVGSFFLAIQRLVSSVDYKVLVKEALLCFHPDRWAARRVLALMENKDEREAIAQAALRVAQEAGSTYEDLK